MSLWSRHVKQFFVKDYKANGKPSQDNLAEADKKDVDEVLLDAFIAILDCIYEKSRIFFDAKNSSRLVPTWSLNLARTMMRRQRTRQRLPESQDRRGLAR